MVDYGTQVAGNLIDGKSVGDALTDVNFAQIGISAVAGALSGGVSAFVPKAAVGTVAKVVVSTAIDAAESAVQQVSETGTVSVTQVATDVAVNKVAGAATKNVSVNSSSTIKTTEKQLDRAQRVAANDPSSSGRSATVKKLETKLANQTGANQAVSQGVSGAASNTIKAVGTASQGKSSLSAPVNSTDNTAIKKPIPIVVQ